MEVAVPAVKGTSGVGGASPLGRSAGVLSGGRGSGGLWQLTEQLAAALDVPVTMAVSEEAVDTDAEKAVGQDVEQEAADELLGGERRFAAAVAADGDAPSADDAVAGDAQQAVVGPKYGRAESSRVEVAFEGLAAKSARGAS